MSRLLYDILFSLFNSVLGFDISLGNVKFLYSYMYNTTPWVSGFVLFCFVLFCFVLFLVCFFLEGGGRRGGVGYLIVCISFSSFFFGGVGGWSFILNTENKLK